MSSNNIIKFIGAVFMLKVNITEFRNNIRYYIELSSREKIRITKNGKLVAILSNPKDIHYDPLISLCGSLKGYAYNDDYDDVIGKEILRKCGY